MRHIVVVAVVEPERQTHLSGNSRHPRRDVCERKNLAQKGDKTWHLAVPWAHPTMFDQRYDHWFALKLATDKWLNKSWNDGYNNN